MINKYGYDIWFETQFGFQLLIELSLKFKPYKFQPKDLDSNDFTIVEYLCQLRK